MVFLKTSVFFEHKCNKSILAKFMASSPLSFGASKFIFLIAFTYVLIIKLIVISGKFLVYKSVKKYLAVTRPNQTENWSRKEQDFLNLRGVAMAKFSEKSDLDAHPQ